MANTLASPPLPSPLATEAPLPPPPVHLLGWHLDRHGGDQKAAVAALDAERRARAEHPWRSGPSRATPAADDHDARCAHDNRFSHCWGCMRAAGLTEKAQRERFDAANVQIHDGEPRDAKPTGTGQSYTPIDPSQAARELIAAQVRAASKGRPGRK